MAKRTAFEKDLQRDLKDPTFRAEYERTRARIDAIDQVLQELDNRRRTLGLTKAELARRANVNEVVIRRLFSAPEPNPTFGTLVALADVLGLRLRTISAKTSPASAPKAPRGHVAAKSPPRIRAAG